MGTVLRIAGKDLRQRARDRSAYLLAIVLPLGLALVYGLIFGQAETPRAFRYAVVDLDRGHIARVFVDEVLPEVARQGFIEIERVDAEPRAVELAESGEVDAALVIPAGFTEAYTAGRTVAISVVGNADAPTAVAVARSLAESYAAELDAIRLAVAATGGPGRGPQEAAALAQRAASVAAPIAIEDVSAQERILSLKTYFAAGMAVFFLFFTVQFGVSSVLDERTAGTLSRLLAAPVSRTAVLAGKLLTSFLLGVISMTVLVVATSFLMGARWGDPLGVGLLIIAGVLAATGVTAVVASLARTADQAGNWQAVIAVVLGLLGGAFFQISQAGGVMETLSLLTPHAWFLRGLGELAGGAPAASALPAVGAMLAFATVTLAIAMTRLEKVMRQ